MSSIHRFCVAIFVVLFLQSCVQSKKKQKNADGDTPFTVCPADEDADDDADEDDCKCYIDEEKFGTVRCENGSIKSANIVAKSTSDGKDFSVAVVRLGGNAITHLEKDRVIPDHVTTVEILDLSHNRIETIDDGAFDGMVKLRRLHLTGNRLTTLERSIFDKGDGVQWHLERLYLEQNRLVDIDGAFDDLSSIEVIVFDDNVKLKLTDSTFGKLHHLRELSFDNCGLEELPLNVFGQLTRLEQLSLRNNPLSVVPPAVKMLPTLTILDISGTSISEFTESALSGDYKLRQLIAHDMGYLWAIEDCAFCGMPDLTEVEFANSSHLYLIHENAFGQLTNAKNAPNEVQLIDFEHCNLSTISEALYPWSDLKTVRLGDNPYHCDCSIAWMTDLSGGGASPPACKTPENLLGRPVSVLRSTDLCPTPIRFGRVTVALGLIVILLVVLWYMCCSTAARERRRCCGFNWRNIYYKPQMPRFAYSNLMKDDERWLGTGDEFVEPADANNKSVAPVEV